MCIVWRFQWWRQTCLPITARICGASILYWISITIYRMCTCRAYTQMAHTYTSKEKQTKTRNGSNDEPKEKYTHTFIHLQTAHSAHKRIHGMIEANESETIIESIYTYIGWEWDTQQVKKKITHVHNTYNNEHFRLLNFSYCSFQNSNCDLTGGVLRSLFTLCFARIAYSFVLAIQNGTK